MPLVPYVKNPTISVTASTELQKSKKLKKLKPIKILLAIPGVRSAYQSISKLTHSKGEKYIVPAKHILKLAIIFKLKAELADETKLLDLAFIDTAPF